MRFGGGIAPFFSAGSRRLDALQVALSKKFANESALWGPAAYALQMVDAPQQMTFDNSATP